MITNGSAAFPPSFSHTDSGHTLTCHQSKATVLFALNQREQALFFPAEPSIPVSPSDHPIEIHFTDTSQLANTPNAWLSVLSSIQPTIIVSAWSTPSLPAESLHLPRYVCHLTGSIRRQVPRVFIERGGLVTNWGGQVAAQVAEHALFLALASLRQCPHWLSLQQHSQNSGAPSSGIGSVNTRTLFERRVGIHGCGSVARALASFLRPFTPHIICHAQGVPRHIIQAAGMTPVHCLEELFSESDILFECEALTATNHGIITANLLSRLPDHALFVNVARGQLVDETALFSEAQSGRIQIALDVMIREPLPANSPWREIPNSIYSPHIAGPTLDRLPGIGQQAMENIRRYLSQEPLAHLVTLDLYDRST